MLKLKKRPDSPNWQIEGACPYTGEFVRQSTKTHSREQAATVLAAELNRRKAEALHGKAGSALFAEAVLEYVAKGGEERFLEPLLDYFGKVRLRDISDIDLTAFCEAHYPGRAKATLRRQAYGPFQAVWNAAVRADLVHEKTFTKPKAKRPPVNHPRSDDWLIRLIRDGLTTPNQKACALFLAFSGRRIGEAVAILVEHFDPIKGRIEVPITKNGKSFVVVLPPFVNAVLARLERRDPKAKLFRFANRSSFRNALVKGCDRAGIEYFSPHQMGRHWFAARFLAGGHSLKALQLAGGWDSIGAVDVYAHMEQSQIHDAVRNIHASDEIQALHNDYTDAQFEEIPSLESPRE